MKIWRLQELGDPIDQLSIVDEPSPEPLYRQFGFEPTGKIEHGEVEGRVAL